MGKNIINFLYYLTVFLITFTAIALMLVSGRYLYEKITLVPSVERKLQTISQEKQSEILSFIQTKENELEQFANQKAEQIVKEEITSKDMEAFAKNNNFKNMFLINPSGLVYLTAFPSAYKEKELATKELTDSELAWSFLRSIMAIVPDVSDFSVDPITGKPALYISIPLFYEGRVGGILSAQVDHEPILSLVNDYEKLGKTGDIVLATKADNAAVLIAPTRLAHKEPFDPIAFRKEKMPIELAVFGNFGSGIKQDFRGERVIAYWRYVIIADWGLVVKIDYHEVSRTLRLCFWLMLATALMLALFIYLHIFVRKKMKK